MKRLTLFFLLICGTVVFSQLDPSYSFAHKIRSTINPAIVILDDSVEINFIHRSSWIGFDDAPSNQVMSFRSPINTGKIGLGASFSRDAFGPYKNTTISMDAGYKVPLELGKGNLIFSLDLSLSSVSFNISELQKIDERDPSLSISSNNRILPNFGTGFIFQKNKCYVGISIPQLLTNKLISSDLEINQQRHVYIHGTFKKYFKNRYVWEPNIDIRVSEGLPFQAQITNVFEVDQTYSLGLMFRNADAVGIQLGYIFKQFGNINYAFDWSYNNKTFAYNYGSHELNLSFNLALFETLGTTRL